MLATRHWNGVAQTYTTVHARRARKHCSSLLLVVVVASWAKSCVFVRYLHLPCRTMVLCPTAARAEDDMLLRSA
jgi:hypothetical protein